MSTDVYAVLFGLDLHMKYTVEAFPLRTYIAYLFLSCDSNPYIRSVGSAFTLLLTIRNAPGLCVVYS